MQKTCIIGYMLLFANLTFHFLNIHTIHLEEHSAQISYVTPMHVN